VKFNSDITFFAKLISGSQGRQAILQAAAEFKDKTCLRLQERTIEQQNFLYFYNGGGCSSSVGYQSSRHQVNFPETM